MASFLRARDVPHSGLNKKPELSPKNSASAIRRCGLAFAGGNVQMSDRLIYELVPTNPQSPLSQRDRQLELAHQMAAILLGKRANEEDRTPYIGSNREVLWLPHDTGGRACTQLMLVDIDVVTIAAVAEIAASLSCELVPCDGGPAVAASAEALVLDVALRSLRRVLPPEKSLFEITCEAPVDDLDEAE
jgi:hypothetical protein